MSHEARGWRVDADPAQTLKKSLQFPEKGPRKLGLSRWRLEQIMGMKRHRGKSRSWRSGPITKDRMAGH